MPVRTRIKTIKNEMIQLVLKGIVAKSIHRHRSIVLAIGLSSIKGLYFSGRKSGLKKTGVNHIPKLTINGIICNKSLLL
jgi:hypothetical protein